MPRDAQTVSDALRRRAKALDRYLRRMELRYRRGEVPKADLKYAYAGAFVTFYTETESRLEESFLGLLTGRIKPPRSVIRPLIEVKSDAVARNILKGDRSFVDWLPYDRTRKRAQAFFSRGEPFYSLDKSRQKTFGRASILRNAIAHRSGSANRLFTSEFVEGKNLPPSDRKPTGYLRGYHATSQRRISLHFAEMVASLDDLCT